MTRNSPEQLGRSCGRLQGRSDAQPCTGPGQGVGAWMWVSRRGQMDVVDMDLAGSVSVFTLSSVSP